MGSSVALVVTGIADSGWYWSDAGFAVLGGRGGTTWREVGGEGLPPPIMALLRDDIPSRPECTDDGVTIIDRATRDVVLVFLLLLL